MKRSLLVFLVAGLALASAASAKGPHAILTTPRETVEPGKPWQFTVELNEFRHSPVPAMIGRRGTRTVGAEVERTPASIDGAAGFRFTMIFPREGRWALLLFAGKRRFAFPAVRVGGAVLPQDYVAFPVGSGMEGTGGDFSPNQVASGRGGSPPRRGQTPLRTVAPGSCLFWVWCSRAPGWRRSRGADRADRVVD